MGLRDEINADWAEIRTDLENPVGTYQGAEYPCIPDGFDKAGTLNIGGEDIEIHGSVRIRVADLGDVVPVHGKNFTFREIVYKIRMAYKDASQAFYCLWLQDPNR